MFEQDMDYRVKYRPSSPALTVYRGERPDSDAEQEMHKERSKVSRMVQQNIMTVRCTYIATRRRFVASRAMTVTRLHTPAPEMTQVATTMTIYHQHHAAARLPWNSRNHARHTHGPQRPSRNVILEDGKTCQRGTSLLFSKERHHQDVLRPRLAQMQYRLMNSTTTLVCTA